MSGQKLKPASTNEKNPPGELKAQPETIARLQEQYGIGPVPFTGTNNAFYERHLVFDNVVGLGAAWPRERFEAFARSVRDVLSQRWLRTEEIYAKQNPKRIYYLLADLKSYFDVDKKLVELYADQKAWARKAILNAAASGKFSRDRTIAEYAKEIWKAKPCPVT